MSARPIIAITGATGFVGQATLNRVIEAKYDIRALTRKSINNEQQDTKIDNKIVWIKGSLEDQASLDQLCEGASCVIHIAGVVNAHNLAGFEKGNVEGTDAVLKAAKDKGCKRFIHISSLSARKPGLSHYGASKAKAEKLVGVSMLDWTIIRPPAIYGPGDMEMLDLFKMAQSGYVLMPPKGKASFIHVDDLAQLIVALVPAHEDATAQIFEVDDGENDGWPHNILGRAIGLAVDKQVTTLSAPKILLKIAALFDRLFRGKKAKLTFDRANYLAHPDWVIDHSKRPSPNLWQPQISTRQGLKNTARWYRKNGLID